MYSKLLRDFYLFHPVLVPCVDVEDPLPQNADTVAFVAAALISQVNRVALSRQVNVHVPLLVEYLHLPQRRSVDVEAAGELVAPVLYSVDADVVVSVRPCNAAGVETGCVYYF